MKIFKSNRPREGTFLGVLYGLMPLLVLIVAIAVFKMYLIAFVISQSAKVAAVYANVFPGVLVVLFFLAVLYTILSFGVFIGRRWALITGIFFNFVFLISNLYSSVKFVFSDKFAWGMFSYKLIALFILSLMLWLSYRCLLKEFYGGENNNNENIANNGGMTNSFLTNFSWDNFSFKNFSWEKLKFWRKDEGDEELTTF